MRSHSISWDHGENEHLLDWNAFTTQSRGIEDILRTLAECDPFVRGTPTRNKVVELYRDTPAIAGILKNTLADYGITDSTYIAKGACAIVCGIPNDEVIRTVVTSEMPRLNSPHILQPRQTVTVGNTGLKVEILARADIKNVSGDHVRHLRHGLAKERKFFWDAYADNVGIIDGRPAVLDAGAVMPEERLMQSKQESFVNEYLTLRHKLGLTNAVPT
ncbi:MAG: hypothetical protein SFW62_08590 [Alphaproteobacteria bacterium]|nr:hypothetical protein [Alphaproteobacteria bacterium]